jgi:hypothetical protein
LTPYATLTALQANITAVNAAIVSSGYSNANVAAYLASYSGNITTTNGITASSVTTTGTSGNITGANVITANTIVATGSGTPTLLSTGALYLSAAATNAVVVTQSLFRLANFTTTQAAALTPTAGDMIFNSTYNTVQIYTGSRWGNITVT